MLHLHHHCLTTPSPHLNSLGREVDWLFGRKSFNNKNSKQQVVVVVVVSGRALSLSMTPPPPQTHYLS